MTDICKQCGNEYKIIATHWSMSSDCSFPPLTEKQKEITTGIVMGDGCINRASKNPKIVSDMTSKNYLEYIDEIFGIFGRGVKIQRTAKESAKNSRESGFNLNAKEENYSDLWRWKSMCHPDLKAFAEWYETGNKVWPEDVELTPTVLKHWYCGDGCWHNNGSKNYITISMSNEIKNRQKVNSIFENVGLPSPSNYGISQRRNGSMKCNAEFTVDQSKELWEYMGEALPDFEYKWPEEYHKS